MKFKDAIGQYVQRKHCRGYKFEHGRAYLLALLSVTGDIDLNDIRERHVDTYLGSQALTLSTWRLKYQVLRSFFDFWFSSEMMAEILMPPPKLPVRNDFTPYVYSKMQVQALVRATGDDRTARVLPHQTLRMFLLLLYGTGTTVGETVGITCQDIDFDDRSILIRNNRYSRMRQIPIGSDLQNALRAYLRWRANNGFRHESLFVTHTDKPVSLCVLERAFIRIRKIAGIAATKGRCFGPRLFDFRYTFAVHRLTCWIRRRKSLNRMLPALAMYMGLSGLESVENI